jgi:hypothetical protein
MRSEIIRDTQIVPESNIASKHHLSGCPQKNFWKPDIFRGIPDEVRVLGPPAYPRVFPDAPRMWLNSYFGTPRAMPNRQPFQIKCEMAVKYASNGTLNYPNSSHYLPVPKPHLSHRFWFHDKRLLLNHSRLALLDSASAIVSVTSVNPVVNGGEEKSTIEKTLIALNERLAPQNAKVMALT